MTEYVVIDDVVRARPDARVTCGTRGERRVLPGYDQQVRPPVCVAARGHTGLHEWVNAGSVEYDEDGNIVTWWQSAQRLVRNGPQAPSSRHRVQLRSTDGRESYMVLTVQTWGLPQEGAVWAARALAKRWAGWKTEDAWHSPECGCTTLENL